VNDVGERVVAALGEPAAREFLEVLERSDADRAAVIARLHARDDAAWLAELLMDLEGDVGEIARLRLVEGLRRAVGGKASAHGRRCPRSAATSGRERSIVALIASVLPFDHGRSAAPWTGADKHHVMRARLL
jgi:hypothetical protein